ncbi:MAG: glycoside hydrolase family 3 C-terminal domain-containing protein, partial [Kiritimatiellae bacterium]|nr:glycoside hydrolase family 3 C-terminal domain-containing protein [Kiritimatiellia bacterium]
LGETGRSSGECRSRRDICLSPAQEALVDALAATGKPLVGLVLAGRPLAFPKTAEKLDAMLWLWQGGSRGAQAAWELVTGKANPSGRLAMTFPRAVGQIPVYYNAQPRCRTGYDEYQDLVGENGPWFPFGAGLSYTTFEYGKVHLECAMRNAKCAMKASVRVKNAGKRAGAETVIWYLSDLESTSTQPARRVVGFEKIPLEPGESKTVRLSLSRKDLAAMQPDGTRRFEPGEFEISASFRASARIDVR